MKNPFLIPDFENSLTSTAIIDAAYQASAALIAALEHRDLYTLDHSRRVAFLAFKVSKRLGLDEQEQARCMIAAVLHDIGKIGVPDQILLNEGRLSKEEFELIKNHSIVGQSITEKLQIPFAEEVACYVRWHHERMDGNGYPDGLIGDEIPVGARIISVVDAYDAIRSDRVYRKGSSQAVALEKIAALAGSSFDPDVVQAITDILAELDDADYF